MVFFVSSASGSRLYSGGTDAGYPQRLYGLIVVHSELPTNMPVAVISQRLYDQDQKGCFALWRAHAEWTCSHQKCGTAGEGS